MTPQAIAKNFTTLIVCRVVAGAAGGTLQNAADGVAANLFKTSKERTLPLTLYIFSLLFGVTMGPVQGAVPKTLSWRW
jgi:MFS family permease